MRFALLLGASILFSGCYQSHGEGDAAVLLDTFGDASPVLDVNIDAAFDAGPPVFASSHSLAIDPGGLYWTDGAGFGVYHRGRGADTAVTRLTIANNPHPQIVLLPDEVFWVQSSRAPVTVRRVPRSDRAFSSLLAVAGGGPIGLAVNDTEVYFHLIDVNGSSLAVHAVDLRSGETRIVVEGVGALDLALDGTALFGTECGRGVWTVPDVGIRAAAVFLAEAYCPLSIAVDQEYVYFVDAEEGPPGNTWGLYRVPRSGGASTRLVWVEQQHFTAHRDHLYFIQDRRVMRILKSGEGLQELAPSLGEVRGIAVDDDFVYWTMSDGDVVSLTQVAYPR